MHSFKNKTTRLRENINLKNKILQLQQPGAAKDLLTQSQQDFPSNITNHFHTVINICNERSSSRRLNVHRYEAHNSISPISKRKYVKRMKVTDK